MGNTVKLPTNLVEAIRYFADADRSFEFVKNLRWDDGEAACPRCGECNPIFITTRKIWKCRGCKRQFSIKVGTIFEDSSLSFGTWLPAMWLIANSKNGISSHELGRALGVTQKTAWFMNHRIRLAMEQGSFEKFTGIVEVDETYVGGLAKNMHKARRAEKIHGTGGTDKLPIQGALNRGGEVVATVIPSATSSVLHANIESWVEPSAIVYTDGATAYQGIGHSHQSVAHSMGEYVRGNVHTNGIENFWSLFKRAWHGTYTHMNNEHAHRYLAERVFSFNNREMTDLERMVSVVAQVSGRRVTYNELKGASV